jgi:phage protein D
VPFDDLAPTLKIEVEGQELNADVTRAITRCEVDLTRDIADMIKLTVVNPAQDIIGAGYGDSFVFLDSRAFQPGNTIKVSMGYGDNVGFIAAGIISKWLPDFRRSGVPVLQIKALDASIRLMDGETSRDARTFDNFDLDLIVRDVLNQHDIIAAQIDGMPFAGMGAGRTTNKKQGMSDYKFLKGLANLAGYEFKVRYNPDSNQWEGFWRAPVSEQERQFTFQYNRGQESTLLDFRAEWGLRDQATTVKVLYFDKSSGAWEEVTVEDIERDNEQILFEGGTDKVTEAINNHGVRIVAGGSAVEVVPNRKFGSLDQATLFAERWLAARRNLFVTGRGSVIGVSELRAGDSHIFEGVGVQLAGEWEMTTVRHVFDQASGYTTQFFANKVLSE